MPGGKIGRLDQLGTAEDAELPRRCLAEWDVNTRAHNAEVQSRVSGAERTFLCGGRGKATVRIIGVARRRQRFVAASIARSYGLSRSAVSSDRDARCRLRDDVRCDQRGVEEHAQERGRGRRRQCRCKAHD